jgi:hypothetical protein
VSLPPEAMAVLPVGSLARVIIRDNTVELRREES